MQLGTFLQLSLWINKWSLHLLFWNWVSLKSYEIRNFRNLGHCPKWHLEITDVNFICLQSLFWNFFISNNFIAKQMFNWTTYMFVYRLDNVSKDPSLYILFKTIPWIIKHMYSYKVNLERLVIESQQVVHIHVYIDLI